MNPTRSRRRILAMFLAIGALPLPGEDERPVVDDRSVAKETVSSEKIPTLWIAGDSTVKSKHPMRGWCVVAVLRSIPTAPLDPYLDDAGKTTER